GGEDGLDVAVGGGRGLGARARLLALRRLLAQGRLLGQGRLVGHGPDRRRYRTRSPNPVLPAARRGVPRASVITRSARRRSRDHGPPSAGVSPRRSVASGRRPRRRPPSRPAPPVIRPTTRT